MFDYTCVPVSGPGGEFATLTLCEINCGPPPIVSYNCFNGNCVDPLDGTGLYSTLIECENECGEGPVTINTIYTTFGTL